MMKRKKIGMGPLFPALVVCLFSALLATPTGVEAQARSQAASDWRTAVTEVAKKAIPAVVHIEIRKKSEAPRAVLDDPFLRHFFGFPDIPRKFRRELRGIGTGSFINPEGYILTNSHVVGEATDIIVQLSDGREFQAKLIGSDPKTDLAVIKISGKESFPYLKFGDSDRVEVGEWVVAIGHPRGLTQTVTQGIISATHRRGITDPSGYQDFLQTDTAINPGNSGGPLLNLDGAMIGVNSVIASSSGGFEGIGFAIPSNMAFYVSKALMTKGKVERGWLGITIRDLDYEQARKLGLRTSQGALVAEVTKGGPAEKGGLRKGAVILEYDGRTVKDAGDLRNAVAITDLGRTVGMTVLREGKRIKVSVRIGSLEEAAKVLASALKGRLGAEFRPVTTKEAEKYGLDAPVGVAVSSLADGPLKEAGIEVNDIILGIDGQMISTIEEFVGTTAVIPPGRDAALLVLDHRTGRTGSVRIRLP